MCLFFRLRLADTLGWELEIMSKGRVETTEDDLGSDESSAGIVVTDSQRDAFGGGGHPRIAAFIWGGKVRPTPTLPYGRWKGAA
ncbi:MAG: hypothetical protein MUO50_00940 [Longimicrobiales bacterium]|nr:hypothetical protein [Longimicrobiales bacterium]